MTTALPTTPMKLHPVLLENPADKLLHHQRKSALYFTAIIISAIGALTIFGSLTAMYLGLLSETSLSGCGMFVVIATGIGCMGGVDYFTKKQVQEKPKIAWYQAVNLELSRIRQWDTQEIQQFYTEHQQSVAHIRPETMALLQQRSPASPLKALLPLIARTQVASHLFKHWDGSASQETKEVARLRSVPTAHPKLIQTHELLQNYSANQKELYASIANRCLQLLANPVTC